MPYDLKGQKFGRLRALKLIGSESSRKAQWECRCDCGNRCKVLCSNLVSGHTRSCGCLRGRPRKDITGQKFGRLTAIKIIGKNKKGGMVWECQCGCGNKHMVALDHLMQGNVTSCGCRFRDRKNIGESSDGYVKRLLIRGTSLRRKDVSTEAIHAKRLELQSRMGAGKSHD